MYTPKSNVTPALVLGLAAVVGLAGCASTKEMESLQAELAAVKTTAEQAGQEASEAKAAAQEGNVQVTAGRREEAPPSSRPSAAHRHRDPGGHLHRL